MRKTTQISFYLLAFICIFFSAEGIAQDFITTWETTTPSETITIPTAPGETYSYDVDWENDGTFDDLGVTGDATHTYPTAGVYTVAVRGTFPRIFFNNSGDKDKILSAAEHVKNISSNAKSFQKKEVINFENLYKIDDILDGKVVRIADFGAFIELPKGGEGLLHISKISKQRVSKVSDVLNENDAVSVRVLKISKDRIELISSEI